MSKTQRGRLWTGWSARRPSLLRPFPSLRVEELEARTVPTSFTWTGAGGNSNWTNGGNWTGGVPTAGADLSFPSGVIAGLRTANNNFPNGTSFNSLTIGESGYLLTGNSITLTQATGSSSISVAAGKLNDQIDLDLSLGAPSGQQQIISVLNGSDLTITGRLAGTSTFTKVSTGLLVLTADNTGFTGLIVIDNNSGALRITNSKALGDNTGDTTVGTNSTLELSGVAGSINEQLRLNGPGVANLGALRSVAGFNNSWTGSVILDSNSTFGADAGTAVNISGSISDSGAGHDVTKEGQGEVRFSNTNTYSGTTTINDGVLTAANAGALGTADLTATTGTTVNETNGKAGQLRISGPNGGGFTILNEQLTLNGDGLIGTNFNASQLPYGGNGYGLGALYNSTGNNNWAGPVVLGSGTSSTNTDYVALGAAPGTDIIVSGVVRAAAVATKFLLEKVEPGRVILNNINTYDGKTRVYDGILNIRDSGALGSGLVDVIDGGTLELEVEAATNTPQFGYDQTTGNATGRDLWDDSVTHDPNRIQYSNQSKISGRGFQDTGALRSRSGINQVTVNVPLSTIGSDGSIGVDLDQRPGHPTPDSSYFVNDYSLTVLGKITGASNTSFIKRGAGHLILPGANTYTGPTQIEQGWVTIENNNSLGARIVGLGDTQQPPTYVLTGAAIHIKSPTPTTKLIIDEHITLAGTGFSHPYSFISSKGALTNIGGDNTWTGDIELLGTTGIGVEQVDPLYPTSELTVTGSTLDSINTQTFSGDGGVKEQVYWIDTGTTGTTFAINWDMTPPVNPPEPIADRLTVYYPPRFIPGVTATQIFNTGYIFGVGSKNLPFGPGTSTIAEFVMNENPPGGMRNSLFSLTVSSPTIPANLIKYGSQRLRLAGDGTYTGSTEVREGTLRIENDTALGRKSSGTLLAQQTYSQTVTTVQSGAVLELRKGIATNNGGISSGIEIWDERLVLNAAAYQVSVAGDPLSATFTLTYTSPNAGTFTTAPIPVNATDLFVQNALVNALLTADGEVAIVTKTGNVFAIVFGNALSKDLPSLTATVSGGAEVHVFNGQSSLVNSAPVFTGSITFARNAAGDLITRNDGGSWLADGYASGDTIAVTGAAGVNNTNFVIAGMAGNVLTVTAANFVTVGTSPSVTVRDQVQSDNFWRGPVTLEAGTRARVDPNTRLALVAAIDDDPTGNPAGSHFTKRGNGELVLAGANTYRGTTLIDQGIVTAASSQAFGFGDGTPSSGTIVSSNAQLQLQGSLTIASEALSIVGTGPNAASVPSSIPIRWLELGGAPINFGEVPGNLPVTGRVTGTAIDPSDSNVIYISTAGGGAWKTKDGGHTWLPLFDLGSPTAPLRGGAIAINPNDPTNIFYGTGEINNANDSFSGTGIYRSTDSGRTWTLITNADGSNPILGQSVSKIVVQPPIRFALPGQLPVTYPLTIYAATSDFQQHAAPAGAPGVWRFNSTAWFNLTASVSDFRATRKGQAPFDTFPPNTAGPDDDYRVRFPQSNVSWTDLALVYYDPDVSKPTQNGNPPAPVPVLYASLVEKGGTWFPPPIAPLSTSFQFGGYNSGVFRAENPNEAKPIWYQGDSGTTPTTPFTPKPDNRSNNEFTAGPFNGAGGPDLTQLPHNGRIQLTADPTETFTAVPGRLWNSAVAYGTISYPISGYDPPGNNGRFFQMYRTGDSGKNWLLLAIPVAMQDYQGIAFQGQGWYDSTIVAVNATTLYAGGSSGRSLWQSTDSGVTFFDITTDTAGNSPHVNQHALAVAPSGDIILGNDGGVWRFTPTSKLWNDLNGTLAITTYNGIDVHPTDFTIAYGGSQDNGTAKFSNSEAWTHVDNGDGGLVQVDPLNPNNVYHITNLNFGKRNASNQQFALEKSTDAGATWNTIWTGTTAYFPFVLDQINPRRIVTSSGAAGIRESLDGGTTFINIDGNVPTNYAGGAASSIAIASYQGLFVADGSFPSAVDIGSNTYDSRTIYAAGSSTVYVTKDDGLTWQNRGPRVTDDLYTITFDTGALKYKDVPQITIASATPGVYLTQRTLQNGDNTGQFALLNRTNKDEIQTLEVVYPTGTVGSFSITVTIPAQGAPYNTPAKTFTINGIALGTSSATLIGMINAQLGLGTNYTGNEVQLIQISNITGAATFTLTVGGLTTAAITVAGTAAATAANINAAFAAVGPPPILGVFASAVLGQIYLTFNPPPNTQQPLVTAAGSNCEVYVKEVQQGGNGRVSATKVAGTGPSLTHVSVDQSNRDTAYVSALYANHQNGPTVFGTTTSGRVWADITGAGLPTSQLNTTQPAWTVVVDPRVDPVTGIATLYVGTDVGVYASTNYGATWSKFGNGMPNVQVKDIVLNQALNTLSAGTYGRSMYQIFLDYAKADSGAIRAVTGNSVWTGPVTLTGNVQIETDGTQNIQNGIGVASLNILGVIDDNDSGGASQAFTITKTGKGTLILSGANTYGGQTLVTEGVVRVNNPSALGTSAPAATANTIVTAGAALELATDLYLEPITINGNGFSFNGHSTGALRNVTGFNTYTGPLTLGTNATIGVDSGSQLTIGGLPGNPAVGVGTVTDGVSSFSLTKELTGTLVLASLNTYDGLTNVNQGAVRVEHALALGSAGLGTRVLDGAQLQISRNNVTLASTVVIAEPLFLSGTGIFDTGAILNIRGDSNPAGTNNNVWRGTILLTELPNFSPITFPDPVVALGSSDVRDTLTLDTVLVQDPVTPAPASVAYAINKVGPGRVTFTKDNAYTGLTSVNGGNLRIEQNNALGPQFASQMQLVTLSNRLAAPTYQLTFAGMTTTVLHPSDSAAVVQAALEALTSINVGNVFVAETNKGAGKVLTVLFRGVFETIAVGAISVFPTPVGVTVSVAVSTTPLALAIAPTNNGGNGYAALDFPQSTGFVPPDTSGAVGPTSFIETVNQALAIYPNKATGAGPITAPFSTFFGGLPTVGGFSDPIVVFDDNIPGQPAANGRFIVVDQNVNPGSGLSLFDIAISKSSSPATLTAADWFFFQIDNHETVGATNFWADYPGNLGYNQDALVVTFNMFQAGGGFSNSQIMSIDINALLSNTPLVVGTNAFLQDRPGGSFRPTAMHDALPGDPMWLVQEGGGSTINVVKMTNVLSNASTFTTTTLAVGAYATAANPLNPDGTVITNNMDSRILKAAQANNTLVASHTVALSATEDAARWYIIDVSSGTPVLRDQGNVTGGNNTYSYFPAIDINPSGQIGMTFMRSGTDTPTDFMSVYVTGRNPSDPAGTMQTPILVPAGTGLRNYSDFTAGGRAGDLSGISIDPVDGSFWGVNEYATAAASNNWGTAVANFIFFPMVAPSPQGTVVNAGSLELDGTLVPGGLVIEEPLVLNGDGVANAGALNNVIGNNTYHGPITLATNTSIGAVGGTTLTVTALVQDPAVIPVPAARLRKAGAGIVDFPDAKDYGGKTQIDDGILRIHTPTSLGKPRSETQTVDVIGTNGSFALSYRGQTTVALSVLGPQPTPTALQVKTALEALSTIGGVGGTVTVVATNLSGLTRYAITFGGTLQNTDVAAIVPIYIAPIILTVRNGNATQSEIQTVEVVANAGFFGLTFSGFATTAIPVNASAIAVQNALNLLPSIGGVGGSVAVSRTGSTNDFTYTVTFGGTLGISNQPQLGSAVVGGTLVTAVTSLDGQGGTTVNSGGTLQVVGDQTFAFPATGELLTLNGQGFNNIGALNISGGNVSWTAPLPILLGSNASIGTTLSTDTLTMFGPISDNGSGFGVDIYGPGTVTYTGDGTGNYNGNPYTIYTGTTRLHDGTLLLNVSPAQSIPAIRGPLVVGDGIGAAESALVKELLNDQVANTSPVTVNSDGKFDLNGLSDTFGNLTVNGGHVYTQPGGHLTTADVDMTGGFIDVGAGGSLNSVNVTMAAGAQINAGNGTTVIFSGDLSMDASSITFTGTGDTFMTGNVTMTNGSTITLPTFSSMMSLDIFMTGGAIDIGDNSTLKARNVTDSGGAINLGNSDTFTATGFVSVSNVGSIAMGTNGHFDITGNLTLADSSITMANGIAGPGSAEITVANVTMTGTSSIAFGNNGKLTTGTVSDTGGGISFVNFGQFMAGGSVAVVDGSVSFALNGLFDNRPNDLSLNNSTFAMGDNGTAKTRKATFSNSSNVNFDNTGTLTATGDLTMTGASNLTFLNTGTATAADISITGGSISFQNGGRLTGNNVTDVGGAIGFSNAGTFLANGTVSVSGGGSIGFGILTPGVPPPHPYVTGDTGSSFTATGNVFIDNAKFWMGDTGTATALSLTLSNGAKMTFNDGDLLTDNGALTMTGGSELRFGDNGKASVTGNLSQNAGLITFLNNGELDSANATDAAGVIAFKNFGIFNSGVVSVTNGGSITFVDSGKFTTTGNLTLTKGSVVLADNGAISTKAVVMTGASKIQMGNTGTLDTTTVNVGAGGSILLGNSDKFTATGTVTAAGAAIGFGTNGLFKITGDLNLDNSQLTLGNTGTVQVLGAGTGNVAMINSSKIAFADTGTLTAVGNLTMTGNSTVAFGNFGTASVKDLSITTGSIAMLDGTNSTVSGFQASGPATIAGAKISLGNNNHFNAAATSIAVSGASPASLAIGANSTVTVADLVMGTSKITMGDNGTFNAANVTDTVGVGTFLFGNNDKFLPTGTVAITNGSVTFGTTGKLAAGGDLTLNNTPILLGAGTIGTPSVVSANHIDLSNKSKITFADNGSLAAATTLGVNNGTIKFGNTGALTTGGDTTLTNASILGGTAITVNIAGKLAMDPSVVAVGDNSNVTTGNIDIFLGSITVGKNAGLTAGIITDNGAPITIGDNSNFSAAAVTLTNASLSQGAAGVLSGGTFATSGNLTLNNSSVALGLGIAGQTPSVSLFASPITLGSGTTLAIAGNIVADSSALGVSSITGLGSVGLGSTTHTASVGNGDGINNVDLAITTGITSTSAERLIKTGAGRLELGPISGTAGGVNITAGDVQVDNPVGPVELSNGATLSGKGTVGLLTGAGGSTAPVVGIVAPGNNWQPAKSGILHSGAAFWGTSTTFSIDLASSTPGSPAPGTDYDRLQVTGAIDLGNAALDARFGTGILLSDSFTIITATGGVTNKFQQFNGQDIVFVTGQKFTIEYTSNSVILHKVRADATVSMTSGPNPSTLKQAVTFTATVVPEPGGILIPLSTTVTFYIDSLFAATVPVALVGSQFQATYQTTTMTSGTHTLTATFDGDANNFNPSSTPPPDVIQTVETPTVDPLAGIPAPPAFVSPNNSLGIQDSFDLSTTVKFERGTINWMIAIKDSTATTVRTLSGTGSPGAGTTIPIAASWDGKNTAAAFVANGDYTATATVVDAFGNTFSTAPLPVVVDNTSPTATAQTPTILVIDPTAASSLATTTTFAGTVGDPSFPGHPAGTFDHWTLTIASGAGTVRTFTGTNPNVSQVWDGKDGSSVVVPDAAYTATLTAFDAAGNTTSATAQTVVVLARGPILTLTTNTATVYGQSITLTTAATLPAGSPASLYSLFTGDTIQFFRGATSLGVATLAFNAANGRYEASLTIPTLNAGTITDFKAVYPATPDFPQGVSNFATHVITKAPLVVTATDTSKAYGAAIPTLPFTATGLVNGETAAAVFSGSLATPASATSIVGTYPITQGGLTPNGNYQITTFNNGVLTVTPASLTIQVNNASRSLNTPNPAFTYTVLGLVNGDSPSVISSLPLGTTAILTSPVGTYPIRSTGAPTVGSNYTIGSILPGVLSILPNLTTFSIGSGPGGIALVSLYSPTGQLIKKLTPFGQFFGGVRTVTADFNGDHVDDLAVGTGPGALAQVTVLDGVTGANLFTTFPFDAFQGGVFVAAGDINSDGMAELVITPDQGGGPRVIVYSGGTFAPLLSYFGINDPEFRGGARAGVGDLNGDGFADIAVSAGFEGGPRVSLWDGQSLANRKFKNMVNDFFVFSDVLRNGAYVAIGDVNGDGKGDLIAGAGPGGGPQVKVFSGASLLNPLIGPAHTDPFANFFAGDPNNRGGVRVAAKVLDADLFVDVLTGVGDGGGDIATAYLGVDLNAGRYDAHLAIDAFPGLNNNGVYVG